jgi:hypothetical protein
MTIRRKALSVVCTVVTLCFVASRSEGGEDPPLACPAPPGTGTALPDQEPELPGVIDGARNPELIPDHVAYRLFLRSLMAPTPEEAAQQQDPVGAAVARQAYGKHVFQTLGLNDPEAAALRTVVEDFGRRVRELDTKLNEIKEPPSPEARPELMVEFEGLQKERDDLVREIVASLPYHLGPAAVARLDRHIHEYVKKRIKVLKGPARPLTQRAGASQDRGTR